MAASGWHARIAFFDTGETLKDLSRRITSGRWLFAQEGHLVGVKSGRELHRLAHDGPEKDRLDSRPDKPVLAGWHVYKKGGRVT